MIYFTTLAFISVKTHIKILRTNYFLFATSKLDNKHKISEIMGPTVCVDEKFT